MAKKGHTFASAAEEVLRRQRPPRALHIDEIWAVIRDEDLVTTNGKTPKATLSHALQTHSVHVIQEGRSYAAKETMFRQVGPQTFELVRSIRHWAVIATPARYDIEAALEVLDEDVWIVPEKSDIREGDRVAIWKAKGRDQHRGVVALAEVLSNPTTIDDPPESLPFWKEPPPGSTSRVRLRFVRPPALPLWLDEDNPGVLGELTVSRGQGSKLYHVTEEQWSQLLDLAGGWSDEPSDEQEAQAALANADERTRARRRGQGFSSDPEFNKAVEDRGMAVATERFKAEDWEVTNTSKNKPYDLLCTRNGEARYVEVKGTTGGPEVVTVTFNEVEHARAHPVESVLFIVHGIRLERGDDEKLRGTGGEVVIEAPWQPASESLKPIAYRYTTKGAE